MSQTIRDLERRIKEAHQRKEVHSDALDIESRTISDLNSQLQYLRLEEEGFEFCQQLVCTEEFIDFIYKRSGGEIYRWHVGQVAYLDSAQNGEAKIRSERAGAGAYRCWASIPLIIIHGMVLANEKD